MKKYDFVETSLIHEPHETYDDIVDQKIFKYKYRLGNDGVDTYERRSGRVLQRFIERAKSRDPALEKDLFKIYREDSKEQSFAQFMLDPSAFNTKAENETRIFREYMVTEALQQYKDYYESDAEERPFFEHMENLSNRDKIRFAEIFEDFTVAHVDFKDFVMIQKREYNPELSLFSNFMLDLVDFKDRVRPLANDMALLDIQRGYQKQNVETLLKERQEFHKALNQE